MLNNIEQSLTSESSYKFNIELLEEQRRKNKLIILSPISPKMKLILAEFSKYY